MCWIDSFTIKAKRDKILKILCQTSNMICPEDFFKLGNTRSLAKDSVASVGRQDKEKGYGHEKLDDEGIIPTTNSETQSVAYQYKDLTFQIHEDEVGASVSVRLEDVLHLAPKHDVLIWDTETCGFKKPAICQIGYLLISDGKIKESREVLLKIPNGIAMEAGAQNIHGISEQDCMWRGEDPIHELSILHNLMTQTFECGGICIGHNVSFDVRAFNFTMEILRNDKRLDKEYFFDTMKKSKDFSPLRTTNGARKNFRLNELYTHLCKCEPCWANLHSALDDVFITAICYCLGRKNNWWR